MSSALIALIIFIITVVLFLTKWIPSAAVAVLSCVLFTLFDVCSFSDAFSGFSSNIVVLVFGMLVVGNALFETGVAAIIGRAVMKLARHDEKRIILIAGTISAVMSMFMSNTAVITIFLAIMSSVVATSPEMDYRNICIPVTLGAMFGGSCTLVGSTPQLTVQAIMQEMAGVEYAMFDYTAVGAILFVVYILYAMFVAHPLGKRIWGHTRPENDENEKPFTDVASADFAKTLQTPVVPKKGEKRKQIIILVIFAGMIVSFVTEAVPIAMTSSIAALLCLITRCTNQKSIIKTMDWPVLIRLAGCLGIAKALSVSGCGDLLAEKLIATFGASINPTVLLGASVLLSMVISNFITNSTAAFIVLPVVLSLVQRMGLSPLPFGIAICYGVNLAFATPLANAQIGLTMIAGYRFSDYFRYTWLLELLVLAVITFCVPLFFPF